MAKAINELYMPAVMSWEDLGGPPILGATLFYVSHKMGGNIGKQASRIRGFQDPLVIGRVHCQKKDES